MSSILIVFLAIPVIGFVVNVLVPEKEEKWLAKVALAAMGLQFIITLLFTMYWAFISCPVIYIKAFTIYKDSHFELYLDLIYDKATAVFLMVGALLAFLITVYSRTYLHRESGFKRFFNTIMLFYLGFNIIVLSGNIATVFIGWEVAGIASFLLIAYYRNRYIPVKNAVKIFSIYKIGDAALIIAMWALHHMWHGNFLLGLENHAEIIKIIEIQPGLSTLFGICLLIASSVKSAQIPFASWLPRAMEGPTPSSAIFYGSLSVHLGVVLLLRTSNFWLHIAIVKYLVIASGVITFIVTSFTARVQPSIKGQIAYSSIAQIGLMFIEIALGWEILVLIHFAGNAFLRSYQLLLSPSLVTYLIRDQFYNFSPRKKLDASGLYTKIKNSIYILSLKEWFLDQLLYYTTWGPLKRIGQFFHFVSAKFLVLISVLFITITLYLLNADSILGEEMNATYYAYSLATFAILLSLWTFTEKKSVYASWGLTGFSYIFIALAILVAENAHLEHIGLYLSGIVFSVLLGFVSLWDLKKREPIVNLKGYQGHCYEHTKIELVFLIAALGLMGFPITTAFLGIEILFGNIGEHNVILLSLISIAILNNSLSLIRMYARIFLGPHLKSYHERARKSS